MQEKKEIKSNFFERIMQIAKYKDFKNVSDFAKNGLRYASPEKLNRLKDSNKKPSIDILLDISNKFEFVNISWLLTGKGDMLKTQENVNYSPVKTKYKSNTDKAVPFYDIDFAAGDIAFIDDNTIIPAYYMDIPEFAGCTAFRIYSDSMEKLIKSGNIVFGTKVSEWNLYIEYGQIYGIIANDGRRFVKYIRKAKNQNNFTLKSENKDYDDFQLQKKEIRSLWLIHGWLNKRV